MNVLSLQNHATLSARTQKEAISAHVLVAMSSKKMERRAKVRNESVTVLPGFLFCFGFNLLHVIFINTIIL